VFTGIIEEVGNAASIQPKSLTIEAGEVLQGMKAGDSIDINGACLTVTGFDANSFSVDIMPETIKRTNLGLLRIGDKVNLERALALGGRLGGHLVQGHVDDTGRVVTISREGEAMLIRFEAPPEVMRYVVEKGFIAVDGISLTVIGRSSNSFEVSVVDYTRRHTNLGNRRAGDTVNLEVDIIAKYVEVLGQGGTRGITADFLKEHGFLVR
jgi:riboflavin synthase